MKGGLIPKYYIRERIFIYLFLNELCIAQNLSIACSTVPFICFFNELICNKNDCSKNGRLELEGVAELERVPNWIEFFHFLL